MAVGSLSNDGPTGRTAALDGHQRGAQLRHLLLSLIGPVVVLVVPPAPDRDDALQVGGLGLGLAQVSHALIQSGFVREVREVVLTNAREAQSTVPLGLGP